MNLRIVFVPLAVAGISASALLPGAGAELGAAAKSGGSAKNSIERPNLPDSVRNLSERFVEFDNPVGTQDILSLADRLDEDVAGVRLVGDMSGEFIFGYRDTLEDELRAVDESVARNFGVAPTIGAVLLKTPPSQEYSSSLRRASEVVSPSGDGFLTEEEIRSRYSPKGLSPGIERLAREAQGSKADPERQRNVGADAWPGAMEVHAISGESDDGDEIWPHMTVWGGWYSEFPHTSFEASSPNNIPDDYGIELDFFLYNDDIDPGLVGRPQCDEENDEKFWANKVPDAIADEVWGPSSWVSNVPSDAVPYFDWADAFDGCDSRNFSNGIVFPQELPKNVNLPGTTSGWNYWFEMTSVPGTEDSSVISLSAQTVYDNCKDMSDFEHYPPEGVSYCMGLTREEHSAAQPYIGRDTHGETAPACMYRYKWSDDVHRTEVGDFFDPDFPQMGSCAIG